jgi:hypothetical protein
VNPQALRFTILPAAVECRIGAGFVSVPFRAPVVRFAVKGRSVHLRGIRGTFVLRAGATSSAQRFGPKAEAVRDGVESETT